MKKVVSVSLGSSQRDHETEVILLGEKFQISRIGTDGDYKKAEEILQKLDGQVDVIGLGGIDVYLYAGNKRYVIQDGYRLLKVVKKTPVVDGSGLKNTLERRTIDYLAENRYLNESSRVLMVSAVDRFGMAEALAKVGCPIIYGDLIFSVGLNFPISSLTKLQAIARKLLPLITKLPFHTLYPLGKKQNYQNEASVNKFARYYLESDIIAGDFHFIRKYLPRKLKGQMIITNTTTREDVQLLAERGVGTLITTTPEFEGRSFGTNVMEGVLLALLEKRQATDKEYLDLINKLNFKPRIKLLNKEAYANS